MQLRFATGLTSEAYVTEAAWEFATLDRCPLHPAGGCGMHRHGTYPRKTPVGARIARWYCKVGQTTFSLIPDCLASRVPGDLDAIESAAWSAEGGRSLEAVAEALRPDIELPGALRWLRRRIEYVRSALVVARGLSLVVLGESMPTLRDVRARLGVAGGVLVRLRVELADHLGSMAAPLGFVTRSRGRPKSRDGPNNRRGRRPKPPGT